MTLTPAAALPLPHFRSTASLPATALPLSGSDSSLASSQGIPVQSAAAATGGGDPLSPGFGMYARHAPSEPRSSVGGGRANVIASGIEYASAGATTYDVETIRRTNNTASTPSAVGDRRPIPATTTK